MTGPPDVGPDFAVEPDLALPDAAPDALPPDAGPARDAALAPVEVHSVETRLGSPATEAGVSNKVTCVALDADGELVDGVDFRFEVRPDTGWFGAEDDDNSVVGERAGDYRVRCTAPDLGLRDGSPSRWDVLPGPAAEARALVDPPLITAGERSGVTCLAQDAYGNAVDTADARVTVSPAAGGVIVEGFEVAGETAGRYRVDCEVAGAISQVGAPWIVKAGRPARLVATLAPDTLVHSVGAVVGFPARLVDRFENPVVGAELVWGAAPALPSFGPGRYFLEAEGRYTLSVQVVSPTFEDVPLRDSVEILVDDGAPSVGCSRPVEGAMLVRQGPIMLEGRVADVAGIQSLTVDGVEAEVAADGTFAVQVEPAWGLNVHQITARDALDNVNSTFCSYFAAERYRPEDVSLPDAILLHLSQLAVDDGEPAEPLASLTDLVRRMLQSPELIATLDQALSAQNPVLPTSCQQRVLGVCVFRLGASYRGMRIRGSRTVSLTLLDGGIRAAVRINNLELDVQLAGTVSNRGTITADSLSATLVFDVTLVNGRPAISLRETESVSVGRLDSNFSGVITGGLLNLVFGAFEGTVRNEVTGALRGFLETEVDSLLSGVLNGLDLAALGLGFELPGFAGNPATELALGLGFSRVEANPQRLRIGISTRVVGPTRQGAESAGVALPPGPVLIEQQPEGGMGAAISLGLVNQLVHRMWRAGVFQLDNAGELLGDLPDGASIGFRVLVPPALRGAEDGGVVLHLGPAVGEFFYPGLFEEPLRLRIAAYATAPVFLDGDSLTFGGDDGIQVNALFVAVEGVALSNQARATLERDLRRILQAIIDGALNGALPTLPIPDFALPDSLADFGIPRGTRLGLRDPVLQETESHLRVNGRFGE